MQEFHYRDFVSRFDANGNLACSCGQTHSLATRDTLVSHGALEQSAALLQQRVGSRTRLWVLSDENTEQAAGRRWKAAAGPARIFSRVLAGSPRPLPTAELVDQLSGEVASAGPQLLVAVGGGVVSDLVKRLSLLRDIPNWCVATAPSVDAYSSGTAAINTDAFHGSIPARASEVIVCDLPVMEKAPRDMHLAGLGDLLAKFLSFLDWNLSRLVTGEMYCPLISDTALQSARTALLAARRMALEPAEAARTLTDAALSSGFAMQALASSRSAASAEHTMAHFWESAHSVGSKRWDFHGILTGATSRIMLHAYQGMYARLAAHEVDEAARLALFDREPAWEQTLEEGIRPFLARVRQQMARRPAGKADLERRLAAYRAVRPQIAELASAILSELSASVDTLTGIGFPFSLRELEIPPESALLALRNIRLLRCRYSTFDLAYDLGLEKEMQELARQAVADAS